MLRSPVVLVIIAIFAVAGCNGGRHEGAGEPTATPLPPAVVADHAARATLPDAPAAKQILFGDLHVHTTFSLDAFLRTLPLMQGEGAHPPADACDFARYCSGLDFWSINDHAEGITPEHWKETKDTIRRCNAIAGDPKNPDLVAFLGWEWTQVGNTAEDHYGHKNVIFRETADDRVPARPISARGPLAAAFLQRASLWQRLRFPILDWSNRQRYFDFGRIQDEIRAVPLCPEGVDTRKLPLDCHESAQTPAVLFEKLAQWGFETLVIPHGTTWGFYTPPDSTFDKQLAGDNYHPETQKLIEIYSGHGNSEEYRSWQPIEHDAKGELRCPEPTKNYLPCCWQAGEIIRARCADPTSADCEARVKTARKLHMQAGVSGHWTIPGVTAEDWKDCGQCRDCFNPAFAFRPQNSVQYALAITNFDDPAHPRRFKPGIIGSSDNHSARPGTGYKEFARRAMTETIGARDETWRERIIGAPRSPNPDAVPIDEVPIPSLFVRLDVERQASFFMTGGLVAVHAAGRDRDSIWQALQHREVYATSGDRILLWFDLLNGPAGALPMGSEARLATAPRFRVRAAGAFEQKKGCPAHATQALGAERLKLLCHDECFYPGDVRRQIRRIEIVRIRPQVQPGEPVAGLVDDPWKRIPCSGDREGCTVEIDDPDFVAGGRPVLYYARAIQEPTPAVNAGGLRCTFDAEGRCTETHPCNGDYRTPFDDDCLSPNEERAWSSPIWLEPAPPAS